MKEKHLFRLYVVGAYCGIASFGYLAFIDLVCVSWFFVLATVGVAIMCSWHNRLLDTNEVRHLQSIVDAPDTSDELRDYFRWAIQEFARNQKKWTFEYWKTQWNFLRQAMREARHTARKLRGATDPIKYDARAWRCSSKVAMRLHHVEKHVNEMVHVGVMLRLGELESRERWRTAKEWFALRDEWRRLVSDPATSPDLRAYYARCLEEFPQTPDFGQRYLA